MQPRAGLALYGDVCVVATFRCLVVPVLHGRSGNRTGEDESAHEAVLGDGDRLLMKSAAGSLCGSSISSVRIIGKREVKLPSSVTNIYLYQVVPRQRRARFRVEDWQKVAPYHLIGSPCLDFSPAFVSPQNWSPRPLPEFSSWPP